MTKSLSNTIMRRPEFEIKYLGKRTIGNKAKYKKQKKIVVKFIKRNRKILLKLKIKSG